MTKRNKIIYWIATIWLALGMVSTGIVQVLKMKNGAGAADSIMHLGYPLYILLLLGVWKLLGAVAVLVPKFPLLKEWTYAGIFFLMTGAIFSHVASGEPVNGLLPALLLLVLSLISWYFRPGDRKLVSYSSK
jgi:hypothetical protein